MLINQILLLLTVSIMGSKQYEGRYSRKTTGYQVLIPKKVNQDGTFLSNSIPHYYKYSEYNERIKKSLNENDFVNYKITISGKEHHLELWPNIHFISPGMVVETVEKYNPHTDSNINVRRLRDTQCHYTGFIRGHEKSQAAISTCYGLAGYISMNDNNYFIEPVKGHNPISGLEHPHIIYKDIDKRQNTQICGTKGNVKKILEMRRKRERINGTIEGSKFIEENKSYYLETLLVLDKTLIDYHRDFDVENYVLTVFNIAHNLFNDASLGVPMDLVLVRMIKLEEEENEMNLSVTKNAEKTMEAFCHWQNRMNPNDDKHPNHHDLAILLTRTDICANDETCGLLGLSKIGGVCDPPNQCNICEDTGLQLGYLITHETGHSLGMEHDDPKTSGCNGTINKDAITVMSEYPRMMILEWSKCSQDYLRAFLDMGFGKCMVDEPVDHEFNAIDVLPGVIYGVDYQCSHILHPNARECKSGLTCSSLNCELIGTGCIHTNIIPAPGTKCGEKKWCYQKKCLSVGERPGTVEGGWSDWLPWSECSRTCGAGVSHAVRFCNNPPPKHGGKFCVGERKRYKICNHTPCEVKVPTFRDLQCAEYDEWIYPEDEKKHKWKTYHLRNDNPCALHCINEEDTVLVMSPRVKDGTYCYRGIRDICIGGVCKEIPCDMDLNSEAVEDACGVCKGNGTSCDIKEGITSIKHTPGRSFLVIRIPKHSTNIRVQETVPSKARILVKNRFRNVTYSNGKELGIFSVPGSKAWLGMLKVEQEALNIPGPVTEDLLIMAHALEDATFSYSLGTKPKEQRLGEYHWDYVDWDSCSATCGKGTQSSVPFCMEKIGGHVDNKYCTKFQKPGIKTKECEQLPCSPRWIIGDWSMCKCEGGNGNQTREVICMKPERDSEEVGTIVKDSHCPKPKPKKEEACKCKQRLRRFRKLQEEKKGKWVKRSDKPVIERGKVIKDKMNTANLKLEIFSEKDGKNQTLTGKEVLMFLEKLKHTKHKN